MGAREQGPGVVVPGASSSAPASQFPQSELPVDGTGSVVEPAQTLTSLRIEPAGALLPVRAGERATLGFRALARVGDPASAEVDVTERVVFFVPDRYLVGTFPADGSPTFTTRLPGAPLEPPQRGGLVTVRADAANADGSIISATTELTVRLDAEISPPAGDPLATPELPAAPADAFSTQPAQPAGVAEAPVLYYPNDGVLLPPNLGELEVHWKPGAGATTDLYDVSFESATASVHYYARCYADAGFEPGACAIRLVGDAYAFVADSNSGMGPLTLSVRAATNDGRVGVSAPLSIEFAEQRVDGATYYWTATDPPRIMRFDFGAAPGSIPETFLQPNDVPNNYACVGCHALSRDGTRMVASLDSSFNAKTIYMADVQSRQLTFNGAVAPQENRILLGSFAPDGSEFVAVAPAGDTTVMNPSRKLFFHDGDTGVRRSSVDLPFQVGHPSWSPDGTTIAMTQIPDEYTTLLELHGGGIAAMRKNAVGWDAPFSVVPAAPGRNRYNPDFVPDSSLLLFSESTDDGTRLGDAYSDPSAQTFAVSVAEGATAVALTNANRGGVADGTATELMNTFPRATPFETKQRGQKLFWFTASSQRRAGLRQRYLPTRNSPVGDAPTQVLLWMFALDPAQVLAGKDGSRPGFYLPFQDLQTSNHMAAWTERLVTDNPPPDPPTPPPPPSQPIPPAPLR